MFRERFGNRSLSCFLALSFVRGVFRAKGEERLFLVTIIEYLSREIEIFEILRNNLLEKETL